MLKCYSKILFFAIASIALCYACTPESTSKKPEGDTETGTESTIIEFSLDKYPGIIKENSIVVKVPYKTSVTSLIANFSCDDAKLYVNDVEQESNVTKNNFSHPVEYTMVSADGTTKKYIVSIAYSNLPVVYIKTKGSVGITSKENWVGESTMTITNTLDEEFDMTYENMNIRGRGNSTWNYPKKPYAIKLDKKAKLLGMPEHKRWVLLANWMDRTCMRNTVAFEIARRTKDLDWTPRGQFVEVVLNGKFLGNYYLCEQIKVDEERVNIAEMKSGDIAGDALTGGYILELDTYFDEVNKFRTNHGTYAGVTGLPIMIKEPDEDVLVSQQFSYIKDYVCNLEELLYRPDISTNSAYKDYLDINSFIDWWFVYELTCNAEPKHPKSSYMYKDKLGKLKAGPVWDFDWGTFVPAINSFCIKSSIWYGRLFSSPDFVAAVKTKWAESKADFDDILNFIDDTTEQISKSAKADGEQWPINPSYTGGYINGDETLSFEQAAKRLKNAYQQRLAWLDQEIKKL